MQILIDANQLMALQHLAKRLETSNSSLVRLAVKKFLQRQLSERELQQFGLEVAS
jgi:predicted transcriptional regulator